MFGSANLGEAVLRVRADTTQLKKDLGDAKAAAAGASGTGRGSASNTRKEVDEVTRALKDYQNRLRQVDADVRLHTASNGKMGISVERAKREVNEITTALTRNSAVLKTTQQSTGLYTTQLGRAASMSNRLNGQMSSMSFGLQVQRSMLHNASLQMGRFGVAGQTASVATTSLANALPAIGIGAGLATAGVVGLGAALVTLDMRGTPIVKEMQRDFVILGESTDDIEGLKKAIDNFGEGFESVAQQFSRGEITKGVTELVKAGREGGEALDLLAAGAKIATIENENLNEISMGLSQVLRQFRFETSETGRIADILAKGALEAQGTIEGLITGLSIVGSVSQVAGISLERTVAALVQLDRAGQDYSDVGATGLRSAINQLNAPSEKAAEIFDRIGINAAGASAKFDQLITAMEQGKISAEDLFVLFETRAVTSVANLDGSVFDMTETLKDSEGVIDDLAGKMADTLPAAQTRASKAFDDLGTTVAEMTAGAKTDFFNWVADSLTELDKLFTRFQQWQMTINGLLNNRSANPDMGIRDRENYINLGEDIETLNREIYNLQLRDPNNEFPNSFANQEIARKQKEIEALKAERAALAGSVQDTGGVVSNPANPNGLPASPFSTTPLIEPLTPNGGGTGGSGRTARTVQGELQKTLEILARNEFMGSADKILDANISTIKSFLGTLRTGDLKGGGRESLISEYSRELSILEEQKRIIDEIADSEEKRAREVQRLLDMNDEFNDKEAALGSGFVRDSQSGVFDPVSLQNSLEDSQLKNVQAILTAYEAANRGGLIEAGSWLETRLGELAAIEQQLLKSTVDLDVAIKPLVNTILAPDPTPRTPERAGYFGLAGGQTMNPSALPTAAAIRARQQAEFLANYEGSGNTLPSYIADPTVGNIGANAARAMGARNASRASGEAVIESFQANTLNAFSALGRWFAGLETYAERQERFIQEQIQGTARAGARGARDIARLNSIYGGGNLDSYTQQLLMRGRGEFTSQGVYDGRAFASPAYPFAMNPSNMNNTSAIINASQNRGGLSAGERVVASNEGFGAALLEEQANRRLLQQEEENKLKQEAADKVAETWINAAATAGNLLVAGIKGELTAGAAISGIGNIAGSFASLANPLAGLAITTGASLLGGLFDSGNNDEEKRRKESLASQNRNLPTLSITTNINVNNTWSGQPSDPQNQQALQQQTNDLALAVSKIIIPTLDRHSNKLRTV